MATPKAKNKEGSSLAQIGGEVPGSTTLVDTVVEAIAGIAAREVAGVHKLGGGTLGSTVAKVRGRSETSYGVVAEVGKKEVAVDLDVVAEYGYNLHEVAVEVRALVAKRLTQMTGMEVKEVNITIVDIHFETEERSARVE